MPLTCVPGLLRPENHASDACVVPEIITELQKAGREKLGRDEERGKKRVERKRRM